jgi:hypothetical protein
VTDQIPTATMRIDRIVMEANGGIFSASGVVIACNESALFKA